MGVTKDLAVKIRQLLAAMAKLEADDQHRNDANFTLTDLSGKAWTLKDLRGKVVLIFGPPGARPVARKCPTWKSLISDSVSKSW